MTTCKKCGKPLFREDPEDEPCLCNMTISGVINIPDTMSKLDTFAIHAPAEMLGRPSPWGEWQTADRIIYDTRLRYQWAHAMLKESKKQNEITNNQTNSLQ